MLLTLTYDGPLHAVSDGNKRLAEKNDIRRKLHPQLQEMWRTHPALESGKHLQYWLESTSDRYQSDGGNHFMVARQVGSYSFVPLVSSRNFMVCGLDILFLRRSQPGGLVHGGDLDNRLKTLLDALSMPTETNQLTGLAKDEPLPFFCLLEDDRFVTELNVRTSQLFEPVPEGGNVSDVRLVIDVTVRVTRVIWRNIGVAS